MKTCFVEKILSETDERACWFELRTAAVAERHAIMASPAMRSAAACHMALSEGRHINKHIACSIDGATQNQKLRQPVACLYLSQDY